MSDNNLTPVFFAVLNILTAVWVGFDSKKKEKNTTLWVLISFFTFPIGFLVYLVMSKRKGGAESAKSSVSFFKDLGEQFKYHYYYKGSGYSISVKGKQFAVCQDGAAKVYDTSKIREIERSWVTPGQTRVHGSVGLTTALSVASANMRDANVARSQSGLFITVADIDNPQWRIKFANKNELLRSYEIFNQAMEGILPEVS